MRVFLALEKKTSSYPTWYWDWASSSSSLVVMDQAGPAQFSFNFQKKDLHLFPCKWGGGEWMSSIVHVGVLPYLVLSHRGSGYVCGKMAQRCEGATAAVVDLTTFFFFKREKVPRLRFSFTASNARRWVRLALVFIMLLRSAWQDRACTSPRWHVYSLCTLHVWSLCNLSRIFKD